MKIKAWGGQQGWREAAGGAGLGQWWYSGLATAVHRGNEDEFSPAVSALWVGWCQPSWGQQGCNPGLSSQAPAQTENFSFVQALSCTWWAAHTWAPQTAQSRWGAVSLQCQGPEGRGLVRWGFCGRRAAEICAWTVPYFALHESPSAFPTRSALW